MRRNIRRVLLAATALALAACAISGCGKSCGCGCEGETATLSGRVLDAMSGNGLNQAYVAVGTASLYAESDGGFLFEDIEAGTVHVEAGTDGYYTYETDIELGDGDDVERDFRLVPESNTWEYRFILRSERPAGLDAHLWVPIGLREGYHVYAGEPGSLVQEPYAALALNDTTGYGPEIVTVRQNNPGGWPVTYHEGEFVFAVRQSGGNSSIPASGAYVEIYHEDDLIETIEAPPGTTGEGWYWYVGRLDCNSGAWTLMNTYSASPPEP